MRYCVKSRLLNILLGSIAISPSFLSAELLPDACSPIAQVQTGAALSGSVMNDSNDTDKRVALIGAIHDFNGNGARDILSVEGSNLGTVKIRDGKTLEQLWQYQLPANAVVTSLKSIGNVPVVHPCGMGGGSSYNDSVPEFAVGVRYSGSTSSDGLFVFNGVTGDKIASFPSILNGLNPYDHNGESYPVLPRLPNVNGMSAMVGPTADGNKLIYGTANDLGGVGVYLVCYHNPVTMQNYEEYKMVKSGVPLGSVSHNLMGNMITLQGPGGATNFVAVDHSLDYHMIQYGLPDPNLLYGGAILYSSGNSNVIYNLIAPRYSHARTGFAAENIGDINGDGFEDLIFSSPSDDIGDSNSSWVDIYSGSNFNPLKSFYKGAGYVGAQYGYAVSGGLDLNADGNKDVVVSSPLEGGTGRIRIMSGPSFDNVAFEVRGSNQGQGFGHGIAVPEANRLITVDRAGNVSLFELGADHVNAKYENEPDGIPDYCQPPPVVETLSAELQAVVDKIYKNTLNIQGLHMSFLAEKGKTNSSKNRQTHYIDGIVKYAKNIRKAISKNEAELLAKVNTALYVSKGDKLVELATKAQSTYKKKKSPKKDLKKVLTQKNLIASLVQDKVTPSLIP